jgi:hypothetical protein
MIYSYKIFGVSQIEDLNKIRRIVLSFDEVKSVEQISISSITIKLNAHIYESKINEKLAQNGPWRFIDEQIVDLAVNNNGGTLTQFLPFLFVVLYSLLGSTILDYLVNGSILVASYTLLSYFIGLWLMYFSLFKFLDLKSFAESFSSYDLIAKRFYIWGYAYPFVEIILSVCYLLLIYQLHINIITFIMAFGSAVSVWIKISNNQKIQYLKLGSVMKVKLSYLTFIESVFIAFLSLVLLIGLA